MKTKYIEAIKKLELRPGCKYLIFIPRATGLRVSDLVELDKNMHDDGWEGYQFCMVDDANDITVVEVPQEK